MVRLRPSSSSGTVTVNPPLSCSIAPPSKTIDSGQSATLTRVVLGWYGYGHVLVVAGWRHDRVDHGQPDRDDDVHGDRQGRDRRDDDRLGDRHGQPGARRARSPRLSKTIDSGQSVTLTASCTGGTAPVLRSRGRRVAPRPRRSRSARPRRRPTRSRRPTARAPRRRPPRRSRSTRRWRARRRRRRRRLTPVSR